MKTYSPFVIAMAWIVGPLGMANAQKSLDNLPRPESPIPYAYTATSNNGKYFFVMLPPPDADLSKHKQGYLDQTNRLTRAYTASGCYRKNESTPVWTYQGPYAFDVFLSNDGESLVIIHGESWFTTSFPMAAKLKPEETAKQLDGPAVSIYRRGELLKTHSVRDVVGDVNNLKNSIAHIQWRAGEGLVDDKGQFNLFTQDAHRCQFDLTTGDLIEKKQNNYTTHKIVFTIIFSIVAIVTLLAIRWLIRGTPASTP